MITLLISFAVFANWQAAQVKGELDTSSLREASGLEFIDAWYQVNDSGDGAFVYRNTSLAQPPQKIAIANMQPLDNEALASTKCANTTCLVIADIGDNLKVRKQINLYFVKVADLQGNKAPLFHRLNLVYPDGPNNAEAVAFDTNGDLFIVSKETESMRVNPAKVYRLKQAKVFSTATETLEQIDSLDIATWQKPITKYSSLITGLDIDSKGNWYVLSYHTAFVLYKNKNQSRSKWIRDVLPIDHKIMRQAEAIHYDEKQQKLIVTTEGKKKKPKQPIYVWQKISAIRSITTQAK